MTMFGLGRVLERARHAREVAHGAEADVEVELLAQRDVERADAAAHRRRQRALDRDGVLAHGRERLLGEPDVAAVDRRRLLAGVDLHPVDPPLAAVAALDGGIDDVLHHRRDVGADPVALDVGDDRVVGRGLARDDLLAAVRNLDVRVCAHSPTFLVVEWKTDRGGYRSRPDRGLRPALPALPGDERAGEGPLRARCVGRGAAGGAGANPLLRRARPRERRAAAAPSSISTRSTLPPGGRSSSASSGCSSTTTSPSSPRRSSTR